ncbi:hypothetical protein K469DRAFT_689587 [Zopfia rhizophila CBS 207.26]|uniref:Uncharacterized protein n=1 Tax=Zopfia rhizophila CBS 207.26 TaxID=1314779 RepID=A0A6A6E1P9_9PEZI|nr:hypothetical protein K469DRAFT_692834 [Zopfia rhizophila CBS 207.26]KAF2183826.1 hypothetical protein K469DRAFT_689587 [Zopfia rhizophila CBS 207.26]
MGDSKVTYKDSDAYKAYVDLGKRPEGMQPFEFNRFGEIMFTAGEKYCRYNMAEDGEELELCPKNSTFSADNLRNHITRVHRKKIAKARAGTTTQTESYQLQKWYTNVMKRHAEIIDDGDAETPAATAPSKGPPVEFLLPKQRRPTWPKTKKGDAKKCPTPDSDCTVFNYFTDSDNDGAGDDEEEVVETPGRPIEVPDSVSPEEDGRTGE